MKFYIYKKNVKLEGCDKRKKISYVLKTKKNTKQNKKKTVATGFEPRTPVWESSVTTTAPANYVIKVESSFYIITYSS